MKSPLVVLLLTVATLASAALSPLWLRLHKDGLHDPTNPGLAQLQEPAEALEHYRRYLEFDPENREARNAVALLPGRGTP